MSIEERIETLERLNIEVQEKLELMELRYKDRFVTSKELAEIMDCSLNNVYMKIRDGKVFATKKLGSIPRIPMSQFYEEEVKKEIRKSNKKTKQTNTEDNKMQALKESIFC